MACVSNNNIPTQAAEGSMHSYVQGLEGEPLDEHYIKLYLASSLPDFLRPLLSAALYLLGGCSRTMGASSRHAE